MPLASCLWRLLRRLWLQLLYPPGNQVHIDKMPPSLVSSRLQSPGSPSLSSYARCPKSLITSVDFCWTLQYTCVSLILGSPALDPALQVCLTRTEQRGQSPPSICWRQQLPLPQGLITGSGSTWWGSTWCPPGQQQVGPSLSWCLGLFLARGRTWHHPFAEHHEVPPSPRPQPAEVPLDGSMTLWCVSQSSQLPIICKLSERVLYPSGQAVDEGVGQCWPLGPSISSQSMEVMENNRLQPAADFWKTPVTDIAVGQCICDNKHKLTYLLLFNFLNGYFYLCR